MMFKQREEVEILEYKSDPVSPEIGEFFIGHVPGTGTADIDISGCRRVKAPHQVQERRFPGTRRPHDRDELTPLYLEINAIKCSNVS